MVAVAKTTVTIFKAKPATNLQERKLLQRESHGYKYVLTKYTQKSNGRYILSNVAIEDVATKILQQYSPVHLRQPMPFDTVDFMQNHLGLLVKCRLIGEPTSGILGLIVMTDTASIPSIDNNGEKTVIEETFGTVLISPTLLTEENMPRCRYTEAHESAHFILHQPFYRWLDKKYETKRERYYSCIACCTVGKPAFKPKTEEDWREWQADKLAAALLMPKRPFTEYVRWITDKMGIRSGYLNMQNADDAIVYTHVMQHIANAFGVSRTAAEIRMKHLGLLIA